MAGGTTDSTRRAARDAARSQHPPFEATLAVEVRRVDKSLNGLSNTRRGGGETFVDGSPSPERTAGRPRAGERVVTPVQSGETNRDGGGHPRDGFGGPRTKGASSSGFGGPHFRFSLVPHDVVRSTANRFRRPRSVVARLTANRYSVRPDGHLFDVSGALVVRKSEMCKICRVSRVCKWFSIETATNQAERARRDVANSGQCAVGEWRRRSPSSRPSESRTV